MLQNIYLDFYDLSTYNILRNMNESLVTNVELKTPYTHSAPWQFTFIKTSFIRSSDISLSLWTIIWTSHSLDTFPLLTSAVWISVTVLIYSPFEYNTVTYKELAWLIIMGSRYDDWILLAPLNNYNQLLELTINLDRQGLCPFCSSFYDDLKSQSHIATDSQSVSKPWCRSLSGAHYQLFITVWQLRSCLCGAPSLSRGQVCLLYMLLALARAVFLGSESLGTRDHILPYQIETSFFVASYDSQGHGGGIRPRLHTGAW
jgi:hypothetical protein